MVGLPRANIVSQLQGRHLLAGGWQQFTAQTEVDQLWAF